MQSEDIVCLSLIALISTDNIVKLTQIVLSEETVVFQLVRRLAIVEYYNQKSDRTEILYYLIGSS